MLDIKPRKLFTKHGNISIEHLEKDLDKILNDLVEVDLKARLVLDLDNIDDFIDELKLLINKYEIPTDK